MPHLHFRAESDKRYYSFDFWRGVACVAVVIFHSSYYVIANPIQPQGGRWGELIFKIIGHFDLGVPLFFVISGYCITATCEKAREKSHSVREFFFRRFWRIFPPYWIAIALMLLMILGAMWINHPEWYMDKIFPDHAPASFSGWQWFGNISLTEIWRWHIVGDHRWMWLAPSWSLNYEEQFYAVCGLLLFFPKIGYFRWVWLITLGVIGLAVYESTVRELPISGFFFDSYWLMFASGILVYFHFHVAKKTKRWIPWIFVAALVGVALWKRATNKPEPIAYLFFALALLLAYPWDIPLARSRWTRPFSYCGIMCYSLYLIHWPIIKPITHVLYYAGVQGCWPTLLITVPLSLAASLLCAWIFHLFVERRFLNTPPVFAWKIPQSNFYSQTTQSETPLIEPDPLL